MPTTNTQAVQTLDELDFERGLWTAAMNGNLSKCKKLLEKGTNPNIRDDSGYTALHYAARSGKLDICRLLVEDYHADVNVKTREGLATPLHRAAFMGRNEVCKFLIQQGARVNEQDADGMTPLHKAVQQGKEETVQLLMSCNADVGVRDKKGRTPDLAVGK